MEKSWIYPSWPAPKNVKALMTLKHLPIALRNEQGLSIDESALNSLRQEVKLPVGQPCWLLQKHGTQIVQNPSYQKKLPEADGFFSNQAGQIGVVLTADCLPVLMCNQAGTEVAALHAGWRGLKEGILEKALALFSAPHETIYVWFGPAIGPQSFEVGEEVFEGYCQQNPLYEKGFTALKKGKWLADLYQLGKIQLSSILPQHFFGGEACTYSDPERFFSYRRSKDSGRMATMIWLEA